MWKIKYFEAKEYYDSYTWEKASYVSFIARIKRNKYPFDKAILPWKLDPYRRKKKSDPMKEFYDNYQWEKIGYRYYKDRVRLWESYEEAIKKKSKLLEGYKYKPKPIKKYVAVNTERRESDYYIEVTYPKEIAVVFRNAYLRMIDDIEEKRRNRINIRFTRFLLVRVTGVEPAASWTPFNRRCA